MRQVDRPLASRGIALGASLTIALGSFLPLYAQNASSSPTPSSNVQAPILRLSPEQPSQWQASVTPQSSAGLPPVPTAPVTQNAPAAQAAQKTTKKAAFQKTATQTVNKLLPKPQEAAAAPIQNPRIPQSEAEAPVSANTALVVGSSSQRIPAGTFLNVRFNTPMDSTAIQPGEPFTVTLLEDFSANQHLILPMGTLIRGRVEQVKRPTYFSKGGAIYLTFDHVVLPSGDLMPLDLKLSTQNTKVNPQGAVYQDPGIPTKLGRSVDKGVGVFQKITDSGYQSGKTMADGLGTILTVPLAAIGGALAGTAVTTGNSAVAVVGKGESAVINPGDTARIDFGGSFNLPSE